MPVATITTKTIPSGTTVAAMRDNLRDWLVADAGITHVKSYSSGSTELAIFNSPDGVGFFAIQITGSYGLSIGTSDAFDAATNTRSGNVYTTSALTISPATASISVTLVVHPEIVCMRLEVGATKVAIGYIKMLSSSKPSWYPSSRPYIILISGSASLVIAGFNTSAYTAKLSITSPSSNTGGRALQQGLKLSTSLDWLGQTSNDIAQVAGNGIGIFDTAVVQAGVLEYLVLEGNSEAICVRSV